MKNFPRLLILLVLALAIALAAFSPMLSVYAESSGNPPDFPSLPEFASSVQNSNGMQVTGIYIADVMAMPVVQQPANQPGFVSTTPETLTQYAAAAKYGTTGLLAHNTLAGSTFASLSHGALITLVYGDGHTQRYVVSKVKKYQALAPTSAYSQFIDLAQPYHTLTSTDLFNQTYKLGNVLILQTCIANGNEASWGRLFVIAEPVSAFPRLQPIRQTHKSALCSEF